LRKCFIWVVLKLIPYYIIFQLNYYIILQLKCNVLITKLIVSHQWCRRGECRGCKRTHKILICWKSGQNTWKSGPKMVPNVWLCFSKTKEKRTKTFFQRSHQKRSSWSLWEKICWQKLYKYFSVKFGEIWAKILRTPKNCLLLRLCFTQTLVYGAYLYS